MWWTIASEARSVAGRGPLQHLLVAVGVAEREDGPAADEAVDAHRLAGTVVDELDLGFLEQHGLAAAQLELHLAAAADDLLGRDAVGFSVHGRMNSMPPPETMKVLKPLARR